MISTTTIFCLFVFASLALAWQGACLAWQMRQQRERDKSHEQLLERLCRHCEALTDRITRQ
jgi:hypothetical protein